MFPLAMKEQVSLQAVLKNRLESLRIRYPSYSMRAFATRAGVSPATMSLIMQGKRAVSQKLALQISERLQFDPQERSEALADAAPRPRRKTTAARHDPYTQLSIDQYHAISDWRAFAILSLTKTRDFESAHSWIATRLGLTEKQVDETVALLLRLGMLEKKNGHYKRSTTKYRTTEDIVNLSLRKSHAQTLDLAQASLENDSIDARDFTWLTLPMDTKQMTLAKTMIRKFQDELSDALETDANPNEVYRLAIQLFPLTKIKNKETK
ncbi:MAG: TIGR02147 family protein [Bdellovibrionales bacterium]|jgi:uncharacterized protein (TIGR02147 family)|nr:TIGR02147 family protein [Bdellovibrionales bacterium]